jgi:hypothetical protein
VEWCDGNAAVGGDTVDGFGENCSVVGCLCESVEINEVAPPSIGGTSLDRGDELLCRLFGLVRRQVRVGVRRCSASAKSGRRC